jgi:hypothetical protein
MNAGQTPDIAVSPNMARPVKLPAHIRQVLCIDLTYIDAT